MTTSEKFRRSSQPGSVPETAGLSDDDLVIVMISREAVNAEIARDTTMYQTGPRRRAILARRHVELKVRARVLDHRRTEAKLRKLFADIRDEERRHGP